MKTSTSWTTSIVKDTKLLPIHFLQDQSSSIQEGTKDILEAHVKTSKSFLGEKINHELVVSSPALEFSFSVLKVNHEILKPYPTKLSSKFIHASIELNTSQILEAKVFEIVRSAEVVEALNALYIQTLNVINQEDDVITKSSEG